ncbi:SDR family NAD(P)-dependent oxidoreductase [Streptomyces sp. NPDC048172]|uniref:SDR family NAD(P)-dependent oxidoreductase n=1 Tax=Streptomyces sp. NPDC048172 TaxID=3365505 RepID=UPI003715C43E
MRDNEPHAWTPAEVPDLSGRTVAVTGASRGIGAATAEHLARHGAHVIALSPSRAEARTVTARGGGPGRVDHVECDLARLAQVRDAAERIVGLAAGRLDVLVNNAGVAAAGPAPSPAGHDMHFAVNHLGHFALTGHVLPALLSAPEPRVVNVSSLLHRLGRDPTRRANAGGARLRWAAYCDSKLANLLFTQGLLGWAHAHGLPLRAVAAHPGLVNTTLGSGALRADGHHIQARLLEWAQARWHTPAQAAWTLVRAATDPYVTGGEFFGPGGRWEWSGSPVRVRAARRACDTRGAERLWRLSQQITEHPFPSAPGRPTPRAGAR